MKSYKQTIAWHEECLKNSVDHWARERVRIAEAMIACEKGEARNKFYWTQIEAAKARGLTEFDRSRLLVPKKKSTTT